MIKIKERPGKALIAALCSLFIISGCGTIESDSSNTDEEATEELFAGTCDTEEDDSSDAGYVIPEELFNSQGVYIQLLAEGDQDLSESDRAEFLATFGFLDSDPFYVHTEEDGYPYMELFFDEEQEIGCGIRYGENSFGNVICGFAFDHCLEVTWHEPDPFSVLSVYGTTGETSVTDYQENYEYDEEGRLLGFQSTGTPTDIDGEEWENIPIIEVSFTYDDQGRLREKEYWHSTTPHLPFGTAYASQTSYYDESERLTHTSSYITHGSLEGYYIYRGGGNVPAYYLELDHQYTSWPTLYRFSSRNDNWEFGGFRRSTEAQFKTYEIEPGGEADFLAEQGFTEQDLFYEYTYEWSWDIVFRLSLYCDEEMTRGVGFIRRFLDEVCVDLEIFTFDGCERYLNGAVGPFSVYSTYNVGRETHFLKGETIEEYFKALDLDEIHAVSFDYEDERLTHMYQGLTHGSVDRFYIYRHGWNEPEDFTSCGYMLEIDHGWGVTFYQF